MTQARKGAAVLEIARIDILPGHAAAFEADVARAAPLFERAAGCRSLRLERSIEHPDRYQLIVEWETLEHHTVDFRGSDDFQLWRALAGPHFAGPPAVEHVVTVLSGFRSGEAET